jgi:uncharacterized membrane protein YczE
MSHRIMRFSAGLVLLGFGIPVMVRSHLGVSSFDVLNTGVAHSSGISLGWVVLITNTTAIVIGLALGQRPGVGTLVSTLGLGVIINLVLPILPTPASLPVQIWFYVAGWAFMTASITLVISSRAGPGAPELLMLGVARHGIPLRWARTATELTCVITGTLLGGALGVGTLVFALSIGHLLAFTLPRAGFAVDDLNPSEVTA